MTGMKFVAALAAAAMVTVPVAATAAEQKSAASALSVVNSLPRATPKAKKGNEAVSNLAIAAIALVAIGVGVALAVKKDGSPKSP